MNQCFQRTPFICIYVVCISHRNWVKRHRKLLKYFQWNKTMWVEHYTCEVQIILHLLLEHKKHWKIIKQNLLSADLAALSSNKMINCLINVFPIQITTNTFFSLYSSLSLSFALLRSPSLSILLQVRIKWFLWFFHSFAVEINYSFCDSKKCIKIELHVKWQRN